MFVLINCNTGVLNDESRVLGVYGTLDMAQRAMAEEVDRILCEFDDDPEDKCVGETHATAYLYRADSPEWHIFEVPGLFVPQEDADWVKACLRDFGVGQTNFEASEMALDVCNVLKRYV